MKGNLVPEYLKKPTHRPGDDASTVSAIVSEIISAVEKGREAAVRRYSEQLDNWSPPSFRVSSDEIRRAFATVDAKLREHIDFAAEQISAFALHQRETLHD